MKFLRAASVKKLPPKLNEDSRLDHCIMISGLLCTPGQRLQHQQSWQQAALCRHDSNAYMMTSHNMSAMPCVGGAAQQGGRAAAGLPPRPIKLG